MKKKMSDEEIFDLTNMHLANYVNFEKIDILITTPQQFETIDEFRWIKNLKPKFVVVDEADEIFAKRASTI